MASKKDYIAIAAVIRAEVDKFAPLEVRALVRIAEGTAAVLHADNPRFDRARFLTAALGHGGIPVHSVNTIRVPVEVVA